ncbi:MAG: Smr/MutS family protein [Bacilli bacterium]|nr:Smr/MutS family protein [Bacilli bacterium]
MISDPFLKILPSIDVHGYTSDEAVFIINEFINDNIKMGKYKIIVIHGKGLGILKKTVYFNFSKDKRVIRLYGDPFNLGITILELNSKTC